MSKVAIIGVSFRFPSTDASRYWADLLEGRDLVTTVDAARWPQQAFLHPGKSHPGTSYTFAAGSIGDVSGFDADFFGISPREAALMDPQQRLLLELSWEAMENAGVKPSSLQGSDCGVYIGIASADYSYRVADDLAAIDSSSATGNTASIAANRLSYFYDLRGPSMAIDTACSSSVVAFHQACRSILSGECGLALAGGVSLHLHPYGFIIFSKASMLSRQGRCRVFDAAGDGYVRSEGGGLFLLKDYGQAVADGDRILAVVAHTAVNTDGRKAGLTVPSHAAQATLLAEAYRRAGIAPTEIDYLEAHGTGTAVGDPVEARALGEALGQRRPAGRPLLIGSVKSNLGHLEAASGVAGLVKALYCLRHRAVPATIGLVEPNPNIHFEEWNLEVATQTRPLRERGTLTVGVNSFGFGGANAHVILQSAERRTGKARKPTKGRSLPLILTAKTEAGLRAAAGGFAEFLRNQPQEAFYDIAYTAALRRDLLRHRAVVFASQPAQAADALRRFAAGEEGVLESGRALDAPSGPAFIYSGNGAQWAGMGGRLLEDPVFAKAVRRIDAVFGPLAGYSLEDELAGRNGECRYAWTEHAQPALFAVQVGITEMLRRGGLNPVAVLGHSVGEVAAAWACGALSLEAATLVVFHRSRLQGTTKGLGQMTAVGLDAQATRGLLLDLGLTARLCLAGFNSPRGVTVAGDVDSLSRLEAALEGHGQFYRRLDLDYAFHSPAMDGIEAGIRQALSGLDAARPAIPFYSSVTGAVAEGASLDAEYWWHNVRHPVLFEDAVKQLLGTGVNVLVEIGPHPVLRSYLNDCLRDAGKEGRVIPTALRGDDDPRRVGGAAGQILVAGAGGAWQVFFPTPGKWAELPHYPWQRETHWHPVTSESLGVLYRNMIHPLLGYPLAQHETAFENPIDTQTHPSLADHVVGESTVFPGTGFVEMALAAALAWQPGNQAEVEDLEIKAPLLLSGEHSKTIRLEIDSQDGTFTVKAREQAGTESLALHAAGRILREPTGILLRQDAPSLPDRDPDFDRPGHEALARSAGLCYGPAYLAIGQGWLEGGAALGVYELPPALAAELDQYHLHPAVLDSAFQLILQILKDGRTVHDGVAFVPAKIGRIAFLGGRGRPRLAQANLLRRSPHSLLADFSIFDESGRPVAVVKAVRFRAMRLQRGVAEQIRHVECRSIPKPHLLSAEAPACLPFEQISQTMKEAVRRCVLKGTHRSYSEEIDPLLEGLCSRFTVESLAALSLRSADVQPSALTEGHPFRSFLLAMAQEDGLVEYDSDSGWMPSFAEESPVTAQDIWNSLVADYPDHFKIIHAVGRVGMHLLPLLDGRLPLQAVRPGDASLPMLSRQVFGGNGKHTVVKALRELVSAALGQLPEGHRFRILEISEGPPWLALELCPSLDFDRGDYVFASLCPASLEEAGRFKEKCPGLEIQPIAGPSDAGRSGDGVHGLFQLAIVSTDFQDEHDALVALEHASARLAPRATLLLAGQHPSRWIDFVFGAQPGWWSTSPTGGYQSSQQTVRFWQGQLERLGFAPTSVLEFSPDTASGPYLLLGRYEGRRACLPGALPAALSRWLILADEQGYSAALAERLRKKLAERGEEAEVLSLGDTDNIGQVVGEALARQGHWNGAIHLLGLNAVPAAREGAQRLGHQIDRCAGVAATVRACEDAKAPTPCWIVTAGAMADTLPGRRPTGWRASTASFGDSALWGFARTLMNESANQATLIDLEDPYTLESVATALEREFSAKDREREIIISGAGARFVPRLRIKPRHADRESNAAEQTSSLRLGFQTPGQLRNLRWEEQPRIVPGNGELEVEVHASGLNFRDVMYALGMLSDEAIENGFAGPTLGLEFAGVVLAVGSGTAGFAPGDRVVGFGPSSFGNRVVTQAGATAHIPSGLSFEAAATIPSAFFTAYYALHHLARLRPGEKVLIHGAAGGVGIAAIQVAKWCGAEIFATAGTDEKRDFLRLLGVSHVYDSRSLAFADEILADTGGKGVDAVLNSLAGEAVNRNLRVLKPFGRFLELGKRDFYENTKIGLRPFRNNISYFGIDADQLMSEQPRLTGQLFGEVMALFAEGVLHPLPYCAFEAEDVVDSFRYMQQSRQIGKIVITYRNGISRFRANNPHPLGLRLPADGTYLVTGGLSGFGLKTAQWLAAKGARHLVLVGRTGRVSGEARQAIAAMESAGAKVMAAACDVADKGRLESLLSEVSGRFPPLRGMVHSAMVIEDALIRNLDKGQILRVFEPKILGAQNLHELSVGLPLDFFILFSSATTLFGNPGQASYVAANTWLEALARHRLGLGLPATCVAWGAIGDTGFLARHSKFKDALQNRMGGAALHSSVALEALEWLVTNGRSGEAVLDFDWRTFSRFLPSAGTPKFGDLAAPAGDVDNEEAQTEDIQRLLAEYSDAELLPTFVNLLKHEVGEILRISPQKIDASRSIHLMGLDSLMGVELAGVLESRFGIRLSAMALNESPTIDKLAVRILMQLRSQEEPETSTGEPEVLNQVLQVISQHAAEVSDNEVARFVEDLESGSHEPSAKRLIH